MAVPLWLFIPYGFVEILAILYFICSYSDIKLSKLKLVQAVIVIECLIIMARMFFAGSFIFLLFGVLIYIFVLWIFVNDFNVKIVVGTIIAFTIFVSVEFLVTYLGEMYLTKLFNYNLVWLITGLPHVFIISVGAFYLKKVRIYNANTEKKAN